MKRPSSARGRVAQTGTWQAAARSVLVPLAQALLDRGLRYPDLVALLGEALAEVARQEGVRGPVAVNRRTGLPRHLVAKAQAAGAATPKLPLSYAAATRLIGRWMTQRGYSENGVARTLPLHGKLSFATLCRMAGADVKVALPALRRLGVLRVSKGQVTLRAPAYIPYLGEAEKLDVLGRDGAEFLRVMLHNVNAPAGRAMLQRKASYDNVGSGSLKRLRAALEREAQQALESADRWLAEADRDRNRAAPGGKRTRVSFGVYLCEEPAEGRRKAKPARHGRRGGRR